MKNIGFNITEEAIRCNYLLLFCGSNIRTSPYPETQFCYSIAKGPHFYAILSQLNAITVAPL